MAHRSGSRNGRARRRQLGQAERKADAARWLAGKRVRELLAAYSGRYGISEADAYLELLELGFQDDLRIEYFENEGISWKYVVEPQSGDMIVVPEDTEYGDLYSWYHSG